MITQQANTSGFRLPVSKKTEHNDPFLDVLTEVRDAILSWLPDEKRSDAAWWFHRLYLAHLEQASSGKGPVIDRDTRGEQVIRSEHDTRLIRLKSIISDEMPDTNQLEADLRWMFDHGLEKALDVLQQLKVKTRRISEELDGLRQDAERAIIWRASGNPNRWLEALRFAGPEEQLWLVTALIARIVFQKETEGRLAAWGNAGLAAIPILTSGQQKALLSFLHDDNAELRAEVAIALGEGGGAGAVSALREVAKCDDVVPVRIQAFRSLGIIGGPDAVNALVELIGEERDLHVLIHAIHSLRHLLSSADSAQRERIHQALRRIAETTDTPLAAREIARHALQATVENEAK